MKITAVDVDVWNSRFENNYSSNYFYSPEWLKIQACIFKLNNQFFEIETTEFKTFMCVQEGQGGRLYSNFIAYGGFLQADGTSMSLDLVRQILTYFETELDMKVVRMKLFPLVAWLGDESKFRSTEVALLTIHESFQKQEANMNKKTRNLIRKAELHGIQVKPLANQDIDKFYVFYKKTMERVGSTYLTPRELFKYFLEAKNVIFLAAYLNNEVIAGSVFMYCRDVMYYWSNSSSNLGRKLDANYAIIKYAIDIARSKKIKWLDMGSSHSQNILDPKLKWGAKLVKCLTYES